MCSDHERLSATFLLAVYRQILEGEHGIKAAVQPVRIHVSLWHALPCVLRVCRDGPLLSLRLLGRLPSPGTSRWKTVEALRDAPETADPE